MKYAKYYLVALLVIIIDQAVKLWVHHNMYPGGPGEIPVFGDWFKLHYTLNPGMAFGVELGSDYGKIILTVFRMVAMVAIGYLVYHLVKNKYHQGLVWCVGLILGGAIGNLIDSIFYGVFIPGNAPHGVSTPWLHGQVIDMFFIDIGRVDFPHWIPLIGGSDMHLWPIFNVADAAIFVGVLIIILNQTKFLNPQPQPPVQKETHEINIEQA
ncbi:lipoprotein signal peptidase [Rufibacter sp. LB8]|uniref:lipoprotein signal peptidase n=1 Tax=Rufibacter sp. LB8 TaxID=2777781 RepID=UPI00178C7E04|nr:lipoprotein signal peptidase [Rufibacter sp. LB8]